MEILRYSAFTDRPDGGNPAGVVLNAQELGAPDMLRIAEEVGFSETAFVFASGAADRTHRIRYFSPRAEVGFCGHATVATAVALAERTAPGTMIFQTNAGQVDVATAADGPALRATLTSVPTSSEPVPTQHLESALKALDWSINDLDPSFPTHVAFAGNHHLMLAAATRQRLAKLDYDFEAMEALSRARNWTTVHLFHRETDTIFHARNPFPLGGVVEDPATGAAAAAFGGYLRAIERVPDSDAITVLQGYDMGRPSRLTIRADVSDPRVSVSGQAVPLA
ncbi:PhzF family phenazine biosynthesis isomerase [Streptomyces sp900105245]|uniref:PhzF family phenazine biosynthesis isomerase n=1 Tax=Streptomyces sp. 900105245 TaxID=3154379 RepID=A0ABV1UKW4_9ACTN